MSRPELMETLETLRRAATDWFNRISALPGFFAKATERRKQRVLSEEREVERLDRIRNPTKYRGK